MKKAFFVVPMLLALSVLASGQPKPTQSAKDSWQQFVFEKENFKVSLPAKPMESTETIESEIGRVPIRTFTSSVQPLYFTVMVAEYPINFDTPEAAKEAVNNGITVMTAKMQANDKEQKDIQIGKYPGLETRAMMPSGLLTVRGVVVQHRMYLLMVMAQNQTMKSPRSAEVSRFFDSFDFVKSPDSIVSTLPKVSAIESPEVESDGPPPSFYTQPISWREFSQPEYGFAVRLPGEPYKNRVKVNPNDSRLDLHLWMARGEGGLIYQAAFQQLLAAPNDEASVKILLDSFRDGMASGAEAKVINEKQISLDGNPGREFAMRDSDTNGVARIYLVGSRIYLLNILNTSGNISSKIANEYFASFKALAMKNAVSKVSGSVVETSVWKDVAEPSLGFAVKMPDTPQKEIKNVADLKITMLMARGDGVMCLVAHLFVPGGQPSKSETAQFFKNLAGGMVNSMKGEIVSEKEISFNGNPGREYKIKRDFSVGVSRAYLVNGHGYLLIALPSLAEGDSTGIPKFLDSFKLTKMENDAPPPPPPPPMPKPEISGKDNPQWEFKPTELAGVPVKVQGILTFNFTLQ